MLIAIWRVHRLIRHILVADAANVLREIYANEHRKTHSSCLENMVLSKVKLTTVLVVLFIRLHDKIPNF